MALYKGTVKLSGMISPTDTEDTYPTHDDELGKGGYRSVANIEAMNLITEERRKEGMIVHCLEENLYFQLQGGILNEYWVSWSLAGQKGDPGLEGPPGSAGLNAYELAVTTLGFEGTEQEWLASLVGKQGLEGPSGPAGKTAYEIALDNGFIGTEQEWLLSLQNGPAGKSAYIVALDNGFIGTEQEWLASLVGKQGLEGPEGPSGPAGKTAYEIALDNGFIGTEPEWLLSLQNGPAGKSAYIVALDNGFEGTEQEWLASLVGPEGKQGLDQYETYIKYIDEYATPTSYFEYLKYKNDIIENIVFRIVTNKSQNNDFTNLNDCLHFITKNYQKIFTKMENKVRIKINKDFIINEQLLLEDLDLSYITIENEYDNEIVNVEFNYDKNKNIYKNLTISDTTYIPFIISNNCRLPKFNINLKMSNIDIPEEIDPETEEPIIFPTKYTLFLNSNNSNINITKNIECNKLIISKKDNIVLEDIGNNLNLIYNSPIELNMSNLKLENVNLLYNSQNGIISKFSDIILINSKILKYNNELQYNENDTDIYSLSSIIRLDKLSQAGSNILLNTYNNGIYMKEPNEE